MPYGYGNTRERPPKEVDTSADQPHPARSMAQKISYHLPPVKRDTPANRRRAKANGWTDAEFDAWAGGEYDEDSVRDG
jgi:hypothetical protein